MTLCAGGVKALPLLSLALLLGPLGAGGEPAEAMVTRLIAEANADMRAQIEATEAKVEAERELAHKNLATVLATVLGRLNRTETDLRQTWAELNQTRGDLTRTQGDLNRTETDLVHMRAALRGAEGRLGTRLTHCEANASALAWLQGTWEARRLQSQGPASQGESVELFRRSMAHLVLQDGTDGTGHRILQAACDAETLMPRMEAVTAECCDEPGEDCSGGGPQSPNAACCGVLMPFFQDCAAEMGAGVDSIGDVLAMCPAGGTGPVATASAGRLFSAVCPPGVLLDTCIPVCDATTNGFVLLLNQVPERRGRSVRAWHICVFRRDDAPHRARRTATTCVSSARCKTSSSRSAPGAVPRPQWRSPQ
jgi:hypothetical protein